jgi:cell wall assembly regulator SMI1
MDADRMTATDDGSVVASWARIESWLDAHAPGTRATLNPPADPAALAAVEAAIGRRLPPDVASSLRCHDGAGPDEHARGRFMLLDGYIPLSTIGIVDQWRMLGKSLSRLGDDMVGRWWHPLWLPVGLHNTGDTLFVDQRPGTGQDAVGDLLTHDGAEVGTWGSFALFLEQTASALESGTEINGNKATVHQGGFLFWQ